MNDELKSIAQLAQELGVTRQAIYQKLKGEELANAVQPYTVKQGNACKYTLQAQELIKQAFGNITTENFKVELTEFKDRFKEVSSELTSCKEQLESALRDLEDKSQELQAKEQALNELTEFKVKFKEMSSESVLNDTEQQKRELQAKEQTLNELKDCKEKLESQISDLMSEKKELEIIKVRFEEKENVISELREQVDNLKSDKDKLNERLDKAEQDRAELIDANRELTIALKAAQALHGMDKKQSAIVDQAETIINDETQQPPKKRSWIDKLLRRK